MKKIKFPALVKAEAKNLKKFATWEELDRLDFDNLKPRLGTKCIYGQMTGDCFSTRANGLIQKCAPRVYLANIGSDEDTVLSTKLNGKLTSPRQIHEHWSPIEKFIWEVKNTKNGKVKRLIEYLKGERKFL